MKTVSLDMVVDDAPIGFLTPAGLEFYKILRGQYQREQAKLDPLPTHEWADRAAALHAEFTGKVNNLLRWANGGTSPESGPGD